MRVLIEFQLVLLVLGLSSGEECQFTHDCRAVEWCKGIQDKSCVCRFGSCIAYGNPFFRGTECDEYTDCACRSTPETCFCKNGKCKADPKEKWECHLDSDCNKYAKCKGKDCTCSGNLCEHECIRADDCFKSGAYCSERVGYTCSCTKSLCALKKLPSECDTIHDCVKLGKCRADQPCSCINNVCTEAHFEKSEWRQKYPYVQCRTDLDCNFFIAACTKDKCTCQQKQKVSKYETYGICVQKSRG